MKSPVDLTSVPQTPEQMTEMVFRLGIQRAYLDISTEARRRRITEHDIALIERHIVELTTGNDTAIGQQFQTFEAEPALAAARQKLKDYFALTREARAQNIVNK